MKIDRRGVFGLLGLGAAAVASPAAANKYKSLFDHGVASGDPLADRMILWTRVAWKLDEPLPVDWAVYADPDLKTVVKKGRALAGPDRDGTVKVDVTGLKPGRDYWYRFSHATGLGDAIVSPTGRTRTLPEGKTKDVVMAVASCCLYPGGYFNAYQAIADLPRVDVVVHLGDYIYEYGADTYGSQTGEKLGRLPDPRHECVTLEDYRRRHACHKADAQLQAAHARAAWIVVWDDHETANDAWEGGAENHQPKFDGDWDARRAAAIKAYYEWMPIREPSGSPLANYRSFHFGDLASLIMTETRLTGRAHQLDYRNDLPMVDGKPDMAAFRAKLDDPARRLMALAQETWMAAELARSVKAGHAWQVIGNQVVMGRIAAPDFAALVGKEKWEAQVATMPKEYIPRVTRLSTLAALGTPYNLDAWDGYPAARERLYGAFTAARASPIVLSGDSHTFWANELYDAGERRVAAEFGATGITSPGAGDVLKDVPLNEGFEARNKEVVYCDQSAKGFVLLTLTRETATGEMVAVSTIMEREFTVKPLKTLRVKPAKGGGVGPLEVV